MDEHLPGRGAQTVRQLNYFSDIVFRRAVRPFDMVGENKTQSPTNILKANR
jgi:hypothetical protein